MQSEIDHLVVTGARLETAARHVERVLGAALQPGGQHPPMATHNRLLSLGAASYLEAIAPDPGQPAPAQPRWFGLDAPPTEPRLSHWVLRVDDLDGALQAAPPGIGRPMAFARGPYRWRITVPDDGRQPFGGVFPALIAWETEPPAAALDDLGLRLVSLRLSHPRAGALGWALSALTEENRVTVREGPAGLTALLHGPNGPVELG